jgi:hypothetical protein
VIGRRIASLAIASLILPAPLAAQVPVQGRADLRILSTIDPCLGPRTADEILVCGRRGAEEPYRVPSALRGQAEAGARIPGTVAGSVDLPSNAKCGIFAGERRCSKADAAEFGYGKGRDPLTVVTKLVSKVTDPD